MVTILIFNRNDSNIFSLLKYLSSFRYDVVIVDSSSEDFFFKLQEAADSLQVVRLYRAPPVGYPDLLYMAGVNLCEDDWVLHLDSAFEQRQFPFS